MEIVFQTIRIIDYENNVVYVRDTPETFSDYVRTLITYINDNSSIREYHTRSANTEVISCILDIVKNQIDANFVTDKMDFIAKRLLLKEQEAQTSVAHMNTNVQKGSLIQALMYDEEMDEHIYLLAKVEHTDFVDDEDFSFKSGFSKDKTKLWKSCTFRIDDPNATNFSAKVYSNNIAKYWYDNFLELDQVVSDEVNTDKAFRAIDSTLGMESEFYERRKEGLTGAELDSSSEKTTERSVLRLFSPLTAIMYAKDDWGELEECSEELFPSELCSYETEILEQIAKEYLLEEGDRGLAVYLDIPELEEKIYSMKPTVEVWHGELWGVLEVESHNQLSEREIEAVKEYWEGQESDGWGEGFEQRGIKIPEGELYVSFWNSGDEFFLTTEEGLKGEEQEPDIQKGGIFFEAL